jgi:hypothetical protein
MGLQEAAHRAAMPTLCLKCMEKEGCDLSHSREVQSASPSPDGTLKSLSTNANTLSASPDSAIIKIACTCEPSTSKDQGRTGKRKVETGASTIWPDSIWQRLNGLATVSDRPWHRTWIRCECYRGHCWCDNILTYPLKLGPCPVSVDFSPPYLVSSHH